MSNLKRIYFYKDNFSKIVFIVLIIILIIVPDFTSAELFLGNDKQNIEEKSRIIFLVNSLTPEEVTKADIIAQNNYELSTYLSLRTTKVDPAENRNEIMILREKYPEYDILQKTVNYNRQAAFDYANYYWDEVCNDGYYMALDVNGTTFAAPFPLGTSYIEIQYFFDHNTTYGQLYGADCAHFVSNCIGNNGGGGLSVPHNYSYAVYGYVSATGLADWILNNNYGLQKYSINDLEMGDVILYDVSGGGRHIVLYLGDGLIAAHSICIWGKTNVCLYGKSWIQPTLTVNKLIHILGGSGTIPTVETRPATSIEQTTAFINARIIDDGGSSIIERRFDWGITPSDADWTDWTADVGVSGDYFSYYLMGLEPDTTYYFRAWAKNSTGWNQGNILSFTTLQEDNYPMVETFNVTPTSVTLGNSFDISYSVSDDVGLSWVELWRTNDKNGQPDENGWTQIGPQYSISGKNYSGEFHDSPSLSGIYWFGIHVGNTAGNWSVEPKPPGPIMVTVTNPTVNPPTGVQATDGTYTDKVRITWNSVSGASYYHVYRATSSGGSKISLGSWQSSTTYDDTSTIPGTTYYYFIKAATNSSGSNASDYSSYDTGFCTIPTSRIIRLEGDLNFGYVQVGTTSQRTLTIYNDGNSTLSVSSINYPTGFSGNWSGPIPAGNSQNVTVTFSPTQVATYDGFLTVNSDATSGANTKLVLGTGVPSTYPPQVTTNDASNITSTSAQLNGNLDSNGNLSCMVWFEYNGSSTPKQPKNSPGPFNYTVSGLDPDTTYYFRACASNAEGIAYGANNTFICGTPTNLELTPSTQSVTIGNQATVNVEVEEVTDLRGANITLNFDASKLQYVSSANGGFIPSSTLLEQSIDNTNGSVTLDIAGLGASAYASGSGTIITVVFERIAFGSTNITFGAITLRDKDNITITHTKGSGCSITYCPSDFDGDNVIGFEDLMIFAMAYGSCEGDANWNPVCDLNSDGCIEFEDLMIFALHYGETCADL